MKWFMLLVVSSAALVLGEDQLQLAERIVQTEEECNRLYKLNDHWNAANYNEEAVLYVDFFFICQDSLADDKYSYIDQNHVDLGENPGDGGMFPVTTSKGEEWVTKPPLRNNDDVSGLQKKLTDFLHKFGGKDNPLYLLAGAERDVGQQIVDQQVRCEMLGLLVVDHPEDENNVAQHTACMDKLNCLKERFMEKHNFQRKKYPDFFPILYKGRGTMITSPPPSDDNPLCIQPVSPEVYKKDLEKWSTKAAIKNKLQMVGKVAEEQFGHFEDAGAELIARLKRIGKGDDHPEMTEEEKKDLMDNVESISLVDSDEDEPPTNMNSFATYAEQLLEKLAKLESQGMEKVTKEKLDLLNEIKPNLEPIQTMASNLNHNMKKIESDKVKPAIKKTMKSLSDAENEMKIKSGAAIEDMKEKLVSVNDVGKHAAKLVKQDGSVLMDKLKSKVHGESESEGTEIAEGHDNGFISGIINKFTHSDLPKAIGNLQTPILLQMLDKVGGHADGHENLMADEHIMDMLNTMKDDIQKKTDDMQIDAKQMKQAAVVLKSVLHWILNAAKHGRGPAKDMKPQEIEDAKALVDELVDFATKAAAAEEEDDEGDDDDKYTDMADLMEDPPVYLHMTSHTATEGDLDDEAEEEHNLETPKVDVLANAPTTSELPEIKGNGLANSEPPKDYKDSIQAPKVEN